MYIKRNVQDEVFRFTRSKSSEISLIRNSGNKYVRKSWRNVNVHTVLLLKRKFSSYVVRFVEDILQVSKWEEKFNSPYKILVIFPTSETFIKCILHFYSTQLTLEAHILKKLSLNISLCGALDVIILFYEKEIVHLMETVISLKSFEFPC